MSDHEGQTTLTDAGRGTDLAARMDLLLQVMQQMREEKKAGQEETALKLARSTIRDPFSFHQKGNENQFCFCEDIEEQLQTASSIISRAKKGAGNETLFRTKDTVQQGMELLS